MVNQTKQVADESILGRSLQINGQVRGEGNLRIEGEIEGNVELSGDLFLEEGGRITGDIQSNGASFYGEFQGNVNASEAIFLGSSSIVRAHLKGSEVSMEEGAKFSGEIDVPFDLPKDI